MSQQSWRIERRNMTDRTLLDKAPFIVAQNIPSRAEAVRQLAEHVASLNLAPGVLVRQRHSGATVIIESVGTRGEVRRTYMTVERES